MEWLCISFCLLVEVGRCWDSGGNWRGEVCQVGYLCTHAGLYYRYQYETGAQPFERVGIMLIRPNHQTFETLGEGEPILMKAT